MIINILTQESVRTSWSGSANGAIFSGDDRSIYLVGVIIEQMLDKSIVPTLNDSVGCSAIWNCAVICPLKEYAMLLLIELKEFFKRHVTKLTQPCILLSYFNLFLLSPISSSLRLLNLSWVFLYNVCLFCIGDLLHLFIDLIQLLSLEWFDALRT